MPSPSIFCLNEDEDDIVVILRSHIYIEHELEQFIHAKLARPHEMSNRLSYF